MVDDPMYEPFARDYAEHAATAPYNALYDRPAVLSLLGHVDGLTVLDAGCGPGLYAEVLVQRGANVIGFDQSPAMIDIARDNVGADAQLRVHDLAEPLDWLAADTVDVVLLALVLNYVDDRVAMLAEFVRVLRPHGVMVVSTTHPTSDWLRQGGSYFAVEPVSESLSPSRDWPIRAWRRPLTQVCREFAEAGLVMENVVEPRPLERMAQTHPDDYRQLEHSPAFIAFRLRPRPAGW